MDEKDRMLKDILSKENIEKMKEHAMPLQNSFHSYNISKVESTNKIDIISAQLEISNNELKETNNKLGEANTVIKDLREQNYKLIIQVDKLTPTRKKQIIDIFIKIGIGVAGAIIGGSLVKLLFPN